MRGKLLLLGALALAAFGGSAAPASAHTLTGHCGVTGTAKFTPGLMSQSQQGHFDFQSGAPGMNIEQQNAPDETTCDGKLDGQDTNGPAVIHVAGDGQLGCLQSSGTDALGTITFPNGLSVPFKMDFTGTLTEVSLTIKNLDGTKVGTGSASFRNYAGPMTPIECGTSGVDQLGFEANADVMNLTDGASSSPSSSSSQPASTASTQSTGSGHTSSAPSGCVVPKTKGMTLSKARASLRASKCSLGRVTKAKSRQKKGTVVGSKPKAGTRLARGAKIALVVSKGKR